MPLQVITIVRKFLVIWAEYHCIWLLVLDMAADRMSSEQTIMRSHVFKYTFCDEDPLRTSGSFEVLIEKTRLIRHVFTTYQLVPLLQDKFYIVIWLYILDSSYIKNIEDVTFAQHTEPVATVIEKSLKVPEWQFSALYSQDRNLKRRICLQ
jgi:hypothetical protein